MVVGLLHHLHRRPPRPRSHLHPRRPCPSWSSACGCVSACACGRTRLRHHLLLLPLLPLLLLMLLMLPLAPRPAWCCRRYRPRRVDGVWTSWFSCRFRLWVGGEDWGGRREIRGFRASNEDNNRNHTQRVCAREMECGREGGWWQGERQGTATIHPPPPPLETGGVGDGWDTGRDGGGQSKQLEATISGARTVDRCCTGHGLCLLWWRV